MKKAFFAILFTSALIAAHAFINYQAEKTESSEKEKINIILILKPTGGIVVKSLSQPTIQAWQSGSNVEVEFLRNLGAATLKVKNGQGQMMYQTTVNTAARPVVAINTAGWPAGSYTLEITAGTSAWFGVFEL